jgi:hypothetical protein
MNTNRQIEISRQIYTRLLGLYPQEHRSEYGTEMALLFVDQCRAAVNQRGKPGLAALWLHTLVDLCKTVLIEHFSTPHARSGLLQGTPGRPLPWKGVLLVLVPGLVFFVSQIGTLTGKDWFFTTLNWAAYAFLVPVLLIWLYTKKFPIWGLVPLGLAFRNFTDQRAYYWLYRLSLLFILPLKAKIQPASNLLVGDGFLGVPLLSFIILVCLAFIVYRRQKFSRPGWVWLGVYALIVFLRPLIELIGALKAYQLDPKYLTIFKYLVSPLVNDLLDTVPAVLFLILILLGYLLAYRHGRAAILLLLGYLLPVILYGTYQTYQGSTTAGIPPVWINTVVFTYRLCIALIAPIWLARSASKRGLTLAVLIPTSIAILSQVGMQIALDFSYNSHFLNTWRLNDIIGIFSTPLTTIAGFILALRLYRSSNAVARKNIQMEENINPSNLA